MTVLNPAMGYRFDRFELQPQQRRLTADGKPVSLVPRAFDLLVALVERGGGLATKEELLARVWPKLVVEEGNLAVQISALRKVLGSGAIETVSGHGYRFTLSVTAVESSPSPAIAPRRDNLPHQPTSFVGRERELAETQGLLAATRLLTLAGVGGIGKTRLSLQLAASVHDGYADGVWFVELAPLSGARLVAQAVASVLGVVEESGRPVLASLTRHIRDRELLLILDNCEHLLQACAELARHLLQAGPRVKLLTTSREPLRVSGETTYVLPTLAVPDPRQPMAAEALSAYEAVRLFLDRAGAARPAFSLTAQNAQAVARICHDLDGIPLALELAAARVRTMAIEGIADRLTDRFRLLKGGDQTALPRQQTLRATIDWSYDLLAPGERALLGRLSVFAGGFTLEAAEAVGAGGAVAGADVMDLLSQLVDKSLVVLDANAGGYGLIETVRQYALERLGESNEESDTRHKHLWFYVGLSERAEQELLGPEQASWHALLDRERENILLAHAHCRAAPGGGAAGLTLIRALRPWFYRNHLELWHRVCMEGLAHPDAQDDSLARSQALFAASSISYLVGHYDHSRVLGEESLRIAQEIGDGLATLDAHVQLGNTCLGLESWGDVRDHCLAALALARRLGETLRAADASTCLGELYSIQGQLALAHPRYVESLALYRQVGSQDYIALGLLNLARVSVSRGDEVEAVTALREAVAINGATIAAPQRQALLTICTGLAAHRTDWPRAARFYGAAEAQHEHTGYRREPADSAFLAPFIASTGNALSASEFAAGVTAGRELGFASALAEARTWLDSLAKQ